MEYSNDCIITLDYGHLDFDGCRKPMLHKVEPYEWQIPETLLDSVPMWTVKDAIDKTLKSYETTHPKSQKDGILILRQFLKNTNKVIVNNFAYSFMHGEVLTINDVFAKLEDRLERYTKYYPDIGNLFMISITSRGFEG